jgi:zinc protease
MVYGFPAVNGSSSQRYAFDVVAQVVGATPITNARGGALFTYVSFSPEKETEVRAALDAEFARLRRDGVNPEELQRAAQSAIGSHAVSLQTRKSRVLEYARSVFSGAGTASVGRYEQSVKAVRADQLRAVIQQYLDPSLLRTGIVRGKN